MRWSPPAIEEPAHELAGGEITYISAAEALPKPEDALPNRFRYCLDAPHTGRYRMFAGPAPNDSPHGAIYAERSPSKRLRATKTRVHPETQQKWLELGPLILGRGANFVVLETSQPIPQLAVLPED
jgi:hypothetical protein